MRKAITLLTVTAVSLSGCTGGKKPSPESRAASANTPANSSHGEASPSASASSVTVRLPEEFATILPATQKSSDWVVPSFTPKQKGYTIFLKCEGEGQISIKYNKEKSRDTWPCDGVITKQQVFAKHEPQILGVSVQGQSQWSIGIVDGAA